MLWYGVADVGWLVDFVGWDGMFHVGWVCIVVFCVAIGGLVDWLVVVRCMVGGLGIWFLFVLLLIVVFVCCCLVL